MTEVVGVSSNKIRLQPSEQAVSFPEGNSGGIGEGMQYQSYNYAVDNLDDGANNEEGDLVNPIDINEPIEGILIPD